MTSELAGPRVKAYAPGPASSSKAGKLPGPAVIRAMKPRRRNLWTKESEYGLLGSHNALRGLKGAQGRVPSLPTFLRLKLDFFRLLLKRESIRRSESVLGVFFCLTMLTMSDTHRAYPKVILGPCVSLLPNFSWVLTGVSLGYLFWRSHVPRLTWTIKFGGQMY